MPSCNRKIVLAMEKIVLAMEKIALAMEREYLHYTLL